MLLVRRIVMVSVYCSIASVFHSFALELTLRSERQISCNWFLAIEMINLRALYWRNSSLDMHLVCCH